MPCLDENTVALYIDGRLAREEAQRAEQHLDTCAICRQLCAEAAREGATDTAPPTTDDLFGPDSVFDRYRIIRLLGSGGMGEVYLARDTRLGRKVALKLIHPKRIASDDARRMFLEEARSTARFNHPNIITLYDAGEVGGRVFLALEYLEGESLRQRMRRERIGSIEAVRIMRAIAGALKEAHAAGVLHRDLKPGNVLIPKDGRVRIIDFGLARDFREGEVEGAIVGTPRYMSPEARRGEGLSAATDVFAFGLIFAELVQEDASVRGLIDRCLSPEPASRPSAAEICDALDAVLYAQRRRDPLASCYRGLSAFREEDADLFFGRDAEILVALELLRDQSVLAIVGPSGAGKSSLVHAGIIPRLRESARCTVLSLRPGHEPIAALASRLSLEAGELLQFPERVALHLASLAEKTKSKVVLVVDQLEELYTMVDDEEARRAFLRALVAAGDDRDAPVRVVLTLRDDFFGHLAETRRLLATPLAVRSPNRAALVEALVAPLVSVGHRFEDPALPGEMVDAVRASPVALPLLEFAASLLWERRDREARLIRRDAYDAMGGVAGALAQHADGVLAGLSRAEMEIARRILLRLVGPENTRRVLRIEEVIAGLEGAASAVLQGLIGGRLVVVRRGVMSSPGAGSSSAGSVGSAAVASRPAGSPAGALDSEVELVHESLILSWHTLRRWIAESRGDRPVLEEALEAAKLWERRGRSVDEVWRGAALADARRALERAPGEAVPAIVREFLALGVKRARRRAIEIRAVVAVAIVALFVFVGALYRQRDAAVSAAARALRESAAAALFSGKHLEARAKLRSSIEVEDSVEARMLWAELERSAVVWKIDFDNVIRALAVAPDGRTIAVTVVDNTVRLIDAETTAMRTLGGYEEQIFAIAFSPDGRRLATGTQGGRVGVWDLASARYEQLGAHEGAVLDLLWDGDRLITCGADATVRVFHGGRESRLAHRPITRLALAADGSRLAGVEEKRVIIFDEFSSTSPNELKPASPSSQNELEMPEPISAIAFAEERLLVGHRSGVLRAIELATGRVEVLSSGHGADVRRIAVDGGRVITGSGDQSLRIDGEKLDAFHEPVIGVALLAGRTKRVVAATYHQVALYAPRPQSIRPATGHTHPAISVNFTPDNQTLASSSTDRTLKLWDVTTGRELATLTGHEGPIHEAAISPDGKTLASPSNDRTIRLWDVATTKERARLVGHKGPIYAVAFSPDGTKLASVGAEKVVFVWDAATARPTHTFSAIAISGALEWSPDGTIIALGNDDGFIRLFDAKTGALQKQHQLHRAISAFITYSNDGRYIASTGEEGMVRRVRLEDGHTEDIARTGGRAWAAAWYPDDRKIAIAASTGAWIKTIDGSMIPLLGHRGEVNAIVLSPDATKLATAGDDGTIRLWNAADGTPIWRYQKETTLDTTPLPESLEGAPASPVQKIKTLPDGLFSAGFASGHVGLWNLATGVRLRIEKLHGAIVDLDFANEHLHVATELGVTDRWDLESLSRDRCALLAEVWRKAPVVWENGRPVLRGPPIAHACANE